MSDADDTGTGTGTADIVDDSTKARYVDDDEQQRQRPKLEWPVDRVRSTFVDFFLKRHGHTPWPSSPCVPHDDPTLLFANAGMNQYKPLFLGTCDPNLEMSTLTRAANSQKCIRAGGKHNALEDVGKDVYHHTFFEMLGNWSFGDYFKAEAIAFAWECLVEVYGLNPDHMYATYFGGDESSPEDVETKELWLKYLPAERVLPFDATDNFWEMGATGPCGPCTEIHYDRIGDRDASSLVNADLPDVIEIWNVVFVQYNREPGGELMPLPLKHIDTGMGLERVTCILQNVNSNYDTDVFVPIFNELYSILCKAAVGSGGDPSAIPRYRGRVGADDPDYVDMAYRVIADHIRTLCFSIADGAVPSNDGRGYVLRRVLRRAVRYGRSNLNADVGFFNQLVNVVVRNFGRAYPELVEKEEFIRSVLTEEEASFGRTLDKGLVQFERMAAKCIESGSSVFSGEDAHTLYTSMGFPVDLTELMAEERGLTLDVEAFEARMEREKERVVETLKDEAKNNDDEAALVMCRFNFGIDGQFSSSVMTTYENQKDVKRQFQFVPSDREANRFMVSASAPKGFIPNENCKDWVADATEGTGARGGGKKDSTRFNASGLDANVDEVPSQTGTLYPSPTKLRLRHNESASANEESSQEEENSVQEKETSAIGYTPLIPSQTGTLYPSPTKIRLRQNESVSANEESGQKEENPVQEKGTPVAVSSQKKSKSVSTTGDSPYGNHHEESEGTSSTREEPRRQRQQSMPGVVSIQGIAELEPGTEAYAQGIDSDIVSSALSTSAPTPAPETDIRVEAYRVEAQYDAHVERPIVAQAKPLKEEKVIALCCGKKIKRPIAVGIAWVTFGLIIMAVSIPLAFFLPQKLSPQPPIAPQVYNLLANVSAKDDLDDPTSPQHQAALWLSRGDNGHLNARDDKERLMQRYILAVLYHSTNGTWWNNKGLFLEGPDECLWQRSEYDLCSGTNPRRISTLQLAGNSMQGVLPSELWLLPHLKHVDFRMNALNGTLPMAVKHATNLKYLDLSSNKFTGTLQTSIMELKDLTHLNLSRNALNGTILPTIKMMHSLQSFDVGENEFSGPLPSEIGQLRSLSYFAAYQNSLTGSLPEVSHLFNLTNMLLHGNKLSGQLPGTLGELKTLKVLNVSGNQFTGTIPVEIAGIGSLKEAYFYKNDLTGDASFLCRARLLLQVDMPQVACTCCSCCLNNLTEEVLLQYSDAAALQNSSSPQGLAATWMRNDFDINHDDPAYVSTKRILQRYVLAVLHYSTNGGDNQNIETDLLDHYSHECEWFSVSCDHNTTGQVMGITRDGKDFGSKTGGHIPTELGLLSNLEKLKLFDLPLMGTIPTELALLSHLKHLILGKTRLTGVIPTQLGLLSHLEHLTLAVNRLTGVIPTQLGLLSNVGFLRLSHGLLNGPVPKQIGFMSNLTNLNLVNNRLTGELPFELSNLTKLKKLLLRDNGLTGDASFLCHLPARESFTVDYMKVNCSCCDIPEEVRRCVEKKNNAADGCSDNNGECCHWASKGECDANPIYMSRNCQLSCGVCTKENSTSGNETIAGGNESIMGGNETIAGGNETITGGNETITGGNATIAGGKEMITSGNETIVGQHRKRKKSFLPAEQIH